MVRKLFLLMLALLVLPLGACAEMQQKHLKPRVSAHEAVPVAADGTIEVLPGDTVYAVSRRYRVPISAIVSANNLPRPYVLQPGTRLQIPAMADYTVQPGDTADTIALASGISRQELLATNAPAMPSLATSGSAAISAVESAELAPIALKPGDVVRVPAQPPVAAAAAPAFTQSNPDALATLTAPAGTTAPVVDNSLAPLAPMGVDTVNTTYQLTPLGPKTTPENVPPPVTAQSAAANVAAGLFDWPLEGRVLKTFGPQPTGGKNDGINIAAPRGTPITAAAGGTVMHAGSVAGLGNLVLLRHMDGLITAYGHLDRVLVDKDTILAQGDVLGTVGESGGVKVPQLHFQVRQGEVPTDPLLYLPAR